MTTLGKGNFDDAIGGLETPRRENVVRLNRRTVFFLALLFVLAFLFVFLWGAVSAPETQTEFDPLLGADEAKPQAIAPTAGLQLPANYGQYVAGLPVEATPEPTPALPEPQAPEPQTAAAAPANSVDSERLAALIKQVEAMQAAQDNANSAALRSPIFFDGGDPPTDGLRPSGGGGSGGRSPIAQLNQLVTGGVPAQGGLGNLGPQFEPGTLLELEQELASPIPEGVRSNLQKEKDEFLEAGRAGDDPPVLSERLLKPASPYMLQSGHTIPAALVTAINTDLPGRIIAQVTQPVYDSVTGQHLLIPQGAKLLGSYDSLISNGQDRALLVWERLILPNGYSIGLNTALGTDPTGAAGKKDQVDYHIGRIIGGVLLSTAISFGANVASDDADGSDEDLLRDSIAQESSRVGSRIVERQLDVQPTIKVRQGARVLVLVEQDIVLAPFEY